MDTVGGRSTTRHRNQDYWYILRPAWSECHRRTCLITSWISTTPPTLTYTKLADQLDVSFDDAKHLMGQHRDTVPFVKALAEMASKRGADTGQIRTLLGRKCRFHLWEPIKFGTGKAMPHDEALKEYGTAIKRAFTY